MMMNTLTNTPVKFGKAAEAQDLQAVSAQYGDAAVRQDLVFSYADPGSKGFLGLGKKVASPDELRADSQALKERVKSTPAQDVFLVLAQADAKPNAVRKQVNKRFVQPFNKPGGGLMNKVLSMMVGLRLDGENMEVTREQDKTIVRIPFQKSSIEKMGDLAVEMAEAVDAGMREAEKNQEPASKKQSGGGLL